MAEEEYEEEGGGAGEEEEVYAALWGTGGCRGRLMQAGAAGRRCPR